VCVCVCVCVEANVNSVFSPHSIVRYAVNSVYQAITGLESECTEYLSENDTLCLSKCNVF